MNWAEASVQWLHILLGTFWFGGVLFSNFVVIPAIMRTSADAQRQFAGQLAAQADRVMPIVAGGTILLGIIRGTVVGDIKDLDALGTGYGIAWLIGLVAACATFAWGKWVLTPAANRLTAEVAEAGTGPEGQPSTAMSSALSRVRVVAMLELLGFFVIFTAMIAMHFAGEA